MEIKVEVKKTVIIKVDFDFLRIVYENLKQSNGIQESWLDSKNPTDETEEFIMEIGKVLRKV